MLSNISNQIDPEGEWQNLQSIGRKDLMRTVNGKTKIETRYFISSLPNNAKLLAQSIRDSLGNRKLSTLGTGCSISGR